MDLHETIIVGSGPAGTSAALALAGQGALVLDVGIDAPEVPADFKGSLYSLRQTHQGLFPHLVGRGFESVRNVFAREKMSLKLKAPYLDYITRGVQEHTPLAAHGFAGALSLSKGGLANGWGAGVYRYTDRDLEAFPVSAGELRPYYDILTREMGVSGANDDLEPWFLREENLQPPLRLNPFMRELLARYERGREELNRQGFSMGRPRTAVLTREKDGRAQYQYDHMDFFVSRIPAVYTPAYTLDRLVRAGKTRYRPGLVVTHFEERPDHVEVFARQADTGEATALRCKRLLLAAGALNTARIVLQSAQDFESRLPFLDNPMACMPLFRPSLIGRAVGEADASAGQLNCIYHGDEELGAVLIAMVSANASLRSDLILEAPLPVGAARACLRQTAYALGMAILFFPARVSAGNWASLDSRGVLHVGCEPVAHPGVEGDVMRLFRSMGFYSHRALVQRPAMGSSLHYAGLLPMRNSPQRHQCHPDGRLAGTRGVYVLDGANFSTLPAKNLTLTIMANAMRIAHAAAGSSA